MCPDCYILCLSALLAIDQSKSFNDRVATTQLHLGVKEDVAGVRMCPSVLTPPLHVGRKKRKNLVVVVATLLKSAIHHNF